MARMARDRSMIEAAIDAIDNAGAVAVFGALMILVYAFALVLLLFCLLAVRGVWRWLSRHTWGAAIARIQRRALR